jgi:hypothetical protein
LLFSPWINNEPALDPGIDTRVAEVVPSCPEVDAVCSGIVVGATAEMETGDSDGDWDGDDAGMKYDANTGDGSDEDGEGSDAGINFGEDSAETMAVCGGGDGVLEGVILP